jgi:hypothetical protein
LPGISPKLLSRSDTQDEQRIVTELRSPLSWFSCASESYRPESLESLWLAFSPVRPWAVPGPSGLRFLEAPTASFRNSGASPLLHFDATWSVLLLRLPRQPVSHVDHDPPTVVPRTSLPALQHLRIPEPFFSPPLSRWRRENVALFPRSLTLGFGYPLGEIVWLQDPRSFLSNPNALGLRSSELFSFRVIGRSSRTLLSALALSDKTLTTLPRRFSGLLPPRKPCPFVPPE